MRLRHYKIKRNFGKTPEPAGSKRTSVKSNEHPMFVIQKHAARRLHYDFRLEMGGVLKSWAVPKGLPIRKGDRRLAIHVEDHPLEYGKFEGTIPAGNYGAGTVMVWDVGTYSGPPNPQAALVGGKLRITLNGGKLHGEWTLVRMKKREGEKQEPWLILKSGDSLKSIGKRQEDQSMLSRRSMKQIAEGKDFQWKSSRKSSMRLETVATVQKMTGLPKAAPRFMSPMKALLVEQLPTDGNWLYEIKFDGVRAIAVKHGQTVQLISRTNHSLTASYPEITNALSQLSSKTAVLDGEVVALDEQGRSSFQLMQPFIHRTHPGEPRPPILFYVFDILNLGGRDATALPLRRRKDILEPLLKGLPSVVRFSASFYGNPQRLLREVRKRGLEGVIGKQAESSYEPGRRSGAWIKIKIVNEQEFVIGGYTQAQGSREYFGSLLVGCYERGQLLFTSKVGSGFSIPALRGLFTTFQKIRSFRCPFVNLPSKQEDPHGFSNSDMKKCTWLKPRLVCQIRFAEWTHGEHLRQPVFLGLRKDKTPKEVMRERPTTSRSVLKSEE